MFFMKNSMKTSSWTFAYLVAPLGLGKFLQIFSAVFWVHFDGYISGDIYGFILNQNRVKIVELLFFDSLIGSLTSLPSFSISSSCYSSGASAIVTLLISSLSLSSMVLQNSKLLSPSLSLSINLQLKKILHHCPTHHKTVAVNLAAYVLMNTSV